MKAVILCGGKGTRFNNGKPGPLKPLIKVNGVPILRHIINIYKKNNVHNFILLGGYKFKELEKFSKKNKDLKITAIFTGVNTNTAGRILSIKKIIKDENFLLTYGDSLADFSLKPALKLKKENNFVMSVYEYKFMYGLVDTTVRTNEIKDMKEKTTFKINAGFYVLDKDIFNYIKNKTESFEKKVINRVLNSKKKFVTNVVKNWFPMDNKKDKNKIQEFFDKKF
jgi:glucose-1-phosphate cytidylyltransferase